MNADLNGLLAKGRLHSIGRVTLDACVSNDVNASVGKGVVLTCAIDSGIKVTGLKNSVVFVEIFVGDIDITSIAAFVALVYVAIHKLLFSKRKKGA
jgi:hypothetical protein